jgi:hypothetical protein
MSEGSRALVTEIGAQREQQEGLIQARAQDLNVAQRLLQITDGRLGREARGFLFDGLARDLGVDPKTEYTRGMKRVILSLDPDGAGALRTMFTSRLDRATPGQVSERARAVINGDIPLQDVIQQASYGLREQAAERQAGAFALFDDEGGAGGPSGSFALGGPAGQVADVGGGVTLTQAPAAEIPRALQVAPRLQEVTPELSSVLGLNPSDRVRNLDVISSTHPAIPTDPAAQRKMANEIRVMRDATVDMARSAAMMADLFRGRPETLSVGLDIPWVGRVAGNPAQWGVQTSDFFTGLDRLLFGGALDRGTAAGERFADYAAARMRGESGEQAEISAATRFAARQTARAISRNLQEQTAESSARIESLAVGMAYALARQAEPSNPRLTDQDVQIQLRRMGRSASPEIFEATLTGLVRDTYNSYLRKISEMTGGSVPVDTTMTQSDIALLANSPLTPPELRQALQQRSGQGAGPELGGAPTVRRVPTIPIGPEGPQPSAPGGEPPFLPAPSQPPPPPPGRRGAAGYPTIEAEEAAARARDEAALRRVERGAELRENEEARAVRTEQRADRAEAERRRQRIQEAFAAIGAALRSTGSAGGGSLVSGGGGDQDAAAFRITPSPQRRPPTPVDAGAFQPQAPALRRR